MMDSLWVLDRAWKGEEEMRDGKRVTFVEIEMKS